MRYRSHVVEIDQCFSKWAESTPWGGFLWARGWKCSTTTWWL